MFRSVFFIIVLLIGVTCAPAIYAEDAVETTRTEIQEPQAPQETPARINRDPRDIENEILFINMDKEGFFRIPLLDPVSEKWSEIKTNLDDKFGLQAGFAYTSLYQVATSAITKERQAAGSDLDLLATWTFLDKDGDHPGKIGIAGLYRHRLGTKLAPLELGGAIGSAWPTTMAYNRVRMTLSQCWYEQHIIKDRIAFRVGKVLSLGLYDYFRYKNPKTAFTDSTFTLNPTVAFANFGLGATGMIKPFENIYIVGGIHDANGNPEKAGFDTFFRTNEYFFSGEIGWMPKFDFGEGDYHITYWGRMRLKEAGRPSGWGFTTFAEQKFGNIVPFLRYGYSSGGAAPLKHMISWGVGIENVFGYNSDLIGIGFSWGRPSNRLLGDQGSGEIFYRMQLTRYFAITPSVQLIVNPARDPENNAIGVFGVRGRFSF